MDISTVTHIAAGFSSSLSAVSQQHGAQGNVAKSGDAVKGKYGLSEQEREQVEKLKARDREVRAHEQAHLAAAAGLAMSGASYTYQRGPDGVSYAIGGEVKIDTSPGKTPEETVQRAQRIKAAAMAPAEPSGADRAVAAKAAQMEAEARAELASRHEEDGSQAEEGAGSAAPAASSRQAQVERHYGAGDRTASGSLLQVWA